jgi:hypothetical protein
MALPEDIQKALDDYDHRVADGELPFNGEFAEEPADSPGSWIYTHLELHLPVIDLPVEEDES